MLFVSKIKQSLSGASPFLIHIFMILSVTAYTLFGAIVMRYIENSEIDRQNLENGYTEAPDREITQSAKQRSSRQLFNAESKNDRVVLNGHELNVLAPGLHDCVKRNVDNLMHLTKCNDQDIDYFVITPIDDCYRNAEIVLNRTSSRSSSSPSSGFKGSSTPSGEPASEESEEQWSFPNAVVFSYTVITTIGYGHVAPVTFYGRLFCIFYGLFGIPLTLLTVADIGMFLSRIVKKLVVYIEKGKDFLRRKLGKQTETPPTSPHESIEIEERQTEVSDEIQVLTPHDGLLPETPKQDDRVAEEDESEAPDDTPEERSSTESMTLCIIFFSYLMIGAFFISLYEPDMGMFKAFYFIFVSCTTVGLGDLVPRSYNFLFLTFIYITIGLALTSMAVEIAAEYLKKLHYFGRKIESVAQVEVWFGGKKMKLKNLIHHLGDQLNVPADELKNLNIDQFVDGAIKVTEGEIKSLRKPQVMLREDGRPLSYRDLRKSGEPSIFYADERSSVVTGGSERPPLAEETARTVSSHPRFCFDKSV